jgi:hypothetical protein
MDEDIYEDDYNNNDYDEYNEYNEYNRDEDDEDRPRRRDIDEDDEDFEREEQDFEREEDEEDFDRDFLDQGDKFVAERSAYERAGGRKSLLDFLGNVFEKGGDKKLEEIQRRLMRSGLSNEENFKVILQAYINRFREDIPITDRDLENIEEILPNISHIKYKNAPAFLMGYYVLDKNKKIDVSRLTTTSNLLKNEDVQKEDIIRYARLISNYV